MALERLGWDARWNKALHEMGGRGLKPGRVVREHRGAWDVVTDAGEKTLKVPGSLRHRSEPLSLPAVGDWVACNLKGRGHIQAVLPRRSLFVRKAAGLKARPQAVAANVDVAFIVLGLDGDFNLRRLERYIAAVADSGAEAVVVLNKRDLDPEYLRRLDEAKGRVELTVVATDAKAGQLEGLRELIRPRTTVCLVGSSGVGKSTLLNRLMGSEVQKTAKVRDRDQRGRHTTTHRELFALPNGALVIDTPGMRELHLWQDSGLERAFDDIAQLAEGCEFRDCEHRTEPNCAVLAAVEAGTLDPERLESWRTLRDELNVLAKQREIDRRRSGRGRPR